MADPTLLSPPTVVAPIYECARVVGVRDVRLDARLELFVDDKHGNPKYNDTKTVRNPKLEEFSLPFGLERADAVYAELSFGSAPTVTSQPETVEDYFAENPLPVEAPRVGATIHECGSRIVVTHAPGARFTRYKSLKTYAPMVRSTFVTRKPIPD